MGAEEDVVIHCVTARIPDVDGNAHGRIRGHGVQLPTFAGQVLLGREQTLCHHIAIQVGKGEGNGGYDAFMDALRSLEKDLEIELPDLIDYKVHIPRGGKTSALTEASISLDISELDHVVELLKPIIDAWKEISESDKQVGYAKQTERDLAKTQQSIGL